MTLEQKVNLLIVIAGLDAVATMLGWINVGLKKLTNKVTGQ